MSLCLNAYRSTQTNMNPAKINLRVYCSSRNEVTLDISGDTGNVMLTQTRNKSKLTFARTINLHALFSNRTFLQKSYMRSLIFSKDIKYEASFFFRIQHTS